MLSSFICSKVDKGTCALIIFNPDCYHPAKLELSAFQGGRVT